VYYFGEKPLFTRLDEIEYVESVFPRTKFFCELIETENPALKSVKAFIDAEKVSIKRMWVWRASCTGVSIAAGDGRGGVEGGALIDKAPHDLSISVSVLGLDSIEDFRIPESRIDVLALHPEAFVRNQRNFLSIVNRPLATLVSAPRVPETLPADALLTFQVDWRVSGRTIPAKYISSWVGRQNTPWEVVIEKKMSELGVEETEWIDSEEQKPSSNGKYSYRKDEIRIAILECDRSGFPIHLVLNFIPKYKTRRFAYLIDNDSRRQEIFVEDDPLSSYEEKKHSDLLSIFTTVLAECIAVGDAPNVGSAATLLVHRVMLQARAAANLSLDTLDEEIAYQDSLNAYRKYLVVRTIT